MGPVVGTEAKVQKGEETGGEETVRWGEGERDTESRSQKGREKKEETDCKKEGGRIGWRGWQGTLDTGRGSIGWYQTP